MRAVDTNILARYYLRDDLAQAKRAQALLAAGDVFIPKTVILELEWVLRGVAEQPPETVLACIDHLVHLPQVTVEDPEQIHFALECSQNGLDFSDALHLAASSHCESLLSFDDHKFARRSRRLGITPPVLVPPR
jgi:predicted nucleic-acid-binding protein